MPALSKDTAVSRRGSVPQTGTCGAGLCRIHERKIPDYGTSTQRGMEGVLRILNVLWMGLVMVSYHEWSDTSIMRREAGLFLLRFLLAG